MNCLYCDGAVVATERYGEQTINVCMFGHRTAYYQEVLDTEHEDMLEQAS